MVDTKLIYIYNCVAPLRVKYSVKVTAQLVGQQKSVPTNWTILHSNTLHD